MFWEFMKKLRRFWKLSKEPETAENIFKNRVCAKRKCGKGIRTVEQCSKYEQWEIDITWILKFLNDKKQIIRMEVLYYPA